MTPTLLDAPVHFWACPSCSVTDHTQRADAHTQMHQCAGMQGLLAPLVEVKTSSTTPDARHRLVFREDYAGTAPALASLVTDHGDGSNDCTVFAPTANFDVSTSYGR